MTVSVVSSCGLSLDLLLQAELGQHLPIVPSGQLSREGSWGGVIQTHSLVIAINLSLPWDTDQQSQAGHWL